MSQNCCCNMNEYLKTTLEKLKSQNYEVLTVVIGNESCDLDSAVSSLAYAAFLHWQHQQMQCKVCTRNKRTEAVKDDIFVPILNVARDDYEIKTEVAHCLAKQGLDKENLVFKDDFDLSILLLSSSSVVLVDHHVLATSDQYLTPYVREIIDHRPIDKSEWLYREDTRSSIEQVGSCSTLVVKRVKELSALFAKDVDFFMANRTCCQMLRSAIILDTMNFSKEVMKGTPQDEEMLLFLETVLEPSDCQAERASLLRELVSAREDVSSLTCAQLLRKDLKVEGDVLVPSLPLLAQEFLGMAGAAESVSEALRLRGGCVALLLGRQLRAGLRRDAAVYCEETSRRDQLCAFLLSWKPSLDLSEDTSSGRSSNKSLRYFSQRNLTASRKQYMPALKQFLNLK